MGKNPIFKTLVPALVVTVYAYFAQCISPDLNKEKKGGQDQLALQLSLFKKKEEKRKFKIRGFPLIV